MKYTQEQIWNALLAAEEEIDTSKMSDTAIKRLVIDEIHYPAVVDIDGESVTVDMVHSSGGEGQGDSCQSVFAAVPTPMYAQLEALVKAADKINATVEDVNAYLNFLDTNDFQLMYITGYYDSYNGFDWECGDVGMYIPAAKVMVDY